ncbi:MAG: NAD-dependent epimerase/dehydratase family protein [Dehalococcoidia bacterium]|nr:NAD-dependent epimerase/dehydratase family protein [Dehalococcoidia bacterium]
MGCEHGVADHRCTRALLDAALAAGVARYLQQSIVMAYVDGGDDWLDESTPFVATPTAAVVAEMEGMVRAVDAGAMAWCILRGGSFVGPDTAQQALLQRLREGREVVPGDGSNYLAPVHVADMTAATALAIERAAAGAVYNVCDEPVRYGDYVDALASGIGAARPPRSPERPAPASCRADATAIRQQLGWMPAPPWLP